MQIELENLLAIGGILVAIVASYFRLKDYIRDRFDDLQQKLYDQSIERIRLESRVKVLESIFREFQGGILLKPTNEQEKLIEQKKKEV